MKYILLLPLLLWGGATLTAQSLQIGLQLLPGSSGLAESSLTILNSHPNGLTTFVVLELNGAGTAKSWKSQPFVVPNGTHRYRLGELFPTLSMEPAPVTAWSAICLKAFSPEQVLLGQHCQPLQVLPRIPPHLVYPFHEETLEVPWPVFSWTPPQPMVNKAALHYTLTLVELTDFHSPEVAILSLPPIYRPVDLTENLHPYAVSAPTLEPGHHYAWQVEAFQQGQSLGRSEVWTFEMGNPGETATQEAPHYVMLREQVGGGFYTARGQIGFRFDAQYGEQMPEVRIWDQQKEEIPVRDSRLDRKGTNLFVLDLPPGSGLQEGAFYLLKVANAKGEVLQVRFRYFYSE